MRRLSFVGALIVISLAFASQAAAATTVPVSMTFTEALIAGLPGQQPCPDIALNFNCGSGEVIPFGHATEEIAFGVACGGTCDLRRIDLAAGSIFMEETASNFSCPGVCGSQGPLGTPFSLTLSDVIVGGTRIFEGATGSLSGTVVVAGWHGQIKLSGTITLTS
jgi:hypothetical protein